MTSAVRARWVIGPFAALALVAALLAVLAGGYLTAEAGSERLDRCARFAQDSSDRIAQDAGTGSRVVVIGDSYSVGLGLEDPQASWPSRLPGLVHVSGFSGSGFSSLASPCGRVAFADRAGAALDDGATVVVVQGGLNDVDRSTAEITAGFGRLMGVLQGQDVLVVGPPMAPSRSGRVPGVDATLAELAATYDVRYLSMTAADLPYLSDDLHLTAAGHQEFGSLVADALAGTLVE